MILEVFSDLNDSMILSYMFPLVIRFTDTTECK